MAGPVAATPSLAFAAYKNVEEIAGKAKEAKEARDNQWKTPASKQWKDTLNLRVKQVAYYAFTTLSIASLVAMPLCVAAAAVTLSVGYLGYAAIATAAMFVFSKLSSRFDSMTSEETQIYDKFKNPLGLENNRDSVPEASALKGARVYFESLVAEKKTDKEKEIQKKKLQVVDSLFDKKVDKIQFRSDIASLATTSLLLETIQHVVKKDLKLAQENIKRIEDGKLLNSSSLPHKNRIEVLMVQLQKPSKNFQDNLKASIASEKGHAVFKMGDLDKVLELAERFPNIQVAR